MRIAAIGAIIMIVLASCSTTSSGRTDSPFVNPNPLMALEISRRIEQIPYLHREELVEHLLWLAQTGEQAIPALLTGLQSEHAKVRSSSAWVLGRIRDRRTIPNLQSAVGDSEPTVQFECARTLVLLGDLQHAPVLIVGLDSDRKEVRYLCHEALKSSTGHDFDYDHLTVNIDEMHSSVLRWRQWWSEYSGDAQFAMNYQEQHGIGMPAAPQGETMPRDQGDQGQGDAGQPLPDPVPESGSSQQSEIEASEIEVVEVPVVEVPVVEVPVAPVRPVTTPPATNGSGNAGSEGSANAEEVVIEVTPVIPVKPAPKPVTGGGNQRR